MTAAHRSVTAELASWPATPAARRPLIAWAQHPLLAGFPDPGSAAEAAVADPVVFAALASRPDDTDATTAALAVLADRLSPIVRCWRRSGLTGEDLADSEADLVAAALAAMRARPLIGADRLAQAAWHQVHNQRRTARARAGRLVPLAAGHDRAAPSDDPCRAPLGIIAEALAAGALSPAGAAAVWAAAEGWSATSCAEAAGCTPAAWRARRSRARRALRSALDGTVIA